MIPPPYLQRHLLHQALLPLQHLRHPTRPPLRTQAPHPLEAVREAAIRQGREAAGSVEAEDEVAVAAAHRAHPRAHNRMIEGRIETDEAERSQAGKVAVAVVEAVPTRLQLRASKPHLPPTGSASAQDLEAVPNLVTKVTFTCQYLLEMCD